MGEAHLVTTTPLDAQYLLMLTVDFKDADSVAKLQIEFKGPLGYLSAMEYPLLTFFMVRKLCIAERLYNFLDNDNSLWCLWAYLDDILCHELQRTYSNSILDWWCYLSWYAGKSCILF